MKHDKYRAAQMRVILCSYTCAALIFSGSEARANINETTDRHLRNQYACQISTTDGIKPEFSAREQAWASWMTGLADLNNDSIPEVIAGYEHEYYEGGGRWAREVYQYGFYSTNPDFEAPAGTRFLAARTMVTQDFNGDGKDDIVFIQSGPDFPPYVPARNEILLSNQGGYQTHYLNGGASLYHGGAAGDFDGDGDVDIVTTPGSQNEILILLNNGDGGFPTVRRLRGLGRIYNIKTWDIDGDGNLDLLFDGHEEPLTVLWGDGRGNFADATIVADLSNSDLMQDAVFIQNQSGYAEVVSLSSLSVSDPLPYQGFSLDLIRFNGRQILDVSNVDRIETPNRNTLLWLNFIHVCDLSSDNDMDIIFESFGSNNRFVWLINEWLFLDKLVWENTDGSFERHAVLNSNNRLLPGGFIPENRFGERELAERLGVSLERYLPAQTYAQRDIETPFVTRYAWVFEALHRSANPLPSAASNVTPVSDRVRCILAERAGELAEGCEAGEVARGTPVAQPSTSTPERNWSDKTIVSDRVRCILAERNGEAAEGC